jgi:alpha-glucosidase
VPLPWSGAAPPFGFGPAGTPWLPQPPSWTDLTAAHEEDDPTSMLWLYRDALAWRRQHPALGDGTMTWIPSSRDVLAFRRSPGFACVVNLGRRPLDVSDVGLARADVLLASVPLDRDDAVPPTSTVWFAVDG